MVTIINSDVWVILDTLYFSAGQKLLVGYRPLKSEDVEVMQMFFQGLCTEYVGNFILSGLYKTGSQKLVYNLVLHCHEYLPEKSGPL